MPFFSFRFGQKAFVVLSFLVLFAFNPQVLSADVPNRTLSGAQLVQTLRDNPENHAARWALAQASFKVGRYDIARYHVERLLRTTSSQANLDTLTEALAKITEADPWGTEFNFALLPSTNIRRLTYNDKFITLLGTFTPTGGGQVESGIGLTFGAGLSYGINLPDSSRLTLSARVDQNVFDSSDLNKTVVQFAAKRDAYAIGRSTTIEPYARFRLDESQSIERRYLGLRLSTRWWSENNKQTQVSLVGENREAPESSASNGPYGSIKVRHSFDLDDRTRFGAEMVLSRSRPEGSYLRYWQHQLSADVSRRFAVLGTVGLFGNVTLRGYDDIFPLTDIIREDESVTLGVSYRPARIEVFGSRPKISCQVEKNASNIALYDYETTDCRITFGRSF